MTTRRLVLTAEAMSVMMASIDEACSAVQKPLMVTTASSHCLKSSQWGDRDGTSGRLSWIEAAVSTAMAIPFLSA